MGRRGTSVLRAVAEGCRTVEEVIARIASPRELAKRRIVRALYRRKVDIIGGALERKTITRPQTRGRTKR